MRISTRFHGPAAVAIGGATTVYTVPASSKAILRHIHVSNPGAAAQLTISIGTSVAGTRIFDGYQIGAATIFDHFCYYVLTAGEFIQVGGGAANVLVITIDGDLSVLS